VGRQIRVAAGGWGVGAPLGDGQVDEVQEGSRGVAVVPGEGGCGHGFVAGGGGVLPLVVLQSEAYRWDTLSRCSRERDF